MFQHAVDILSSLASLIAISSVLIAWYVSKRNPLVITKVLIHKKKNDNVYNLYVKNRRDYPVTIETIRVFTKKTYRIEKMNNSGPELLTSFPIGGCVFESLERNVIGPDGNTRISYNSKNYFENATRYIFVIESSHGYFESNCKNIDTVRFETIVLGMESMKEFQSHREAYWHFMKLKYKYFLETVKEKLTKCSD